MKVISRFCHSCFYIIEVQSYPGSVLYSFSSRSCFISMNEHFDKGFVPIVMTSSNGNIFRVAGHLYGEIIVHRWIPLTTFIDAELQCFLWSRRINGWINNREAGDLRRPRPHYDVTVMNTELLCLSLQLVILIGNSWIYPWNDVTLRLRSPAARLFVQPFIRLTKMKYRRCTCYPWSGFFRFHRDSSLFQWINNVTMG